MHEVSLMQNLCAAVADSTREHGISRVLRVKLRIGCDCLVLHDALLFAFDLLKPEPLMQDAVLEIEAVPGRELVIDQIEGEK